MKSFRNFNPHRVTSPAYVIDTVLLKKNLQHLHDIKEKASVDGYGFNILLALKAFTLPAVAPLMMQYLDGCCASGLYEARIGHEEYKKHVHVYGAGYKDDELQELMGYADDMVFNSLYQLEKARAKYGHNKVSFGLRLNPQISTVDQEVYDPSAFGSRLGVTKKELEGADLTSVDGLHIHNLCYGFFKDLLLSINWLEDHFGDVLHKISWLNLGGGHNFMDENYECEKFIAKMHELQQKYKLKIFVEPGTCVPENTGVVVTEVLDIAKKDICVAIIDASPVCHMPTIMEEGLKPPIMGESAQGSYRYRLGGMTCLTGDVLGDYSFDKELRVKDRLLIENQTQYTLVRQNYFNGIPCPHVYLWNSEDDTITTILTPKYEDFRVRFGQ